MQRAADKEATNARLKTTSTSSSCTDLFSHVAVTAWVLHVLCTCLSRVAVILPPTILQKSSGPLMSTHSFEGVLCEQAFDIRRAELPSGVAEKVECPVQHICPKTEMQNVIIRNAWQHRNVSISEAKRILWHSLGGCGTSFRLASYLAAAPPQHKNVNISNEERMIWHSLLEAALGCGTSFRLARYLPPAPSTAQACQHSDAKRILWHSLLGAAVPCALSASRAFHSTGMSASYAKRILWHSLLEAAAPHFALRTLCLPRISQRKNVIIS